MSYELAKVLAPLPKCVRGCPVVINTDPKNRKQLLYTNGNTVIIREAEDPSVSDLYCEHSKDAAVAKYSPSGFYICSGDAAGKIRIWDTTQKEHLLKYEYQPLSGKIKDIDWTEDSKRLVLVGEGRETYGAAILWDSGSTVGSIKYHAKTINSVAVKQTRPYRVVTASEDFTVGFYEGPPFKFTQSNMDHTNFVNCVRYSPSGSIFISGSADGKAFVFDGKTGEKIQEVREEGQDKTHKGGIYAITFSPDGRSVATASADKTVKIWNAEDDRNIKHVSTTTIGSAVEDMQCGAIWLENYLVSVSLSGFFNYINPEVPDAPSRIVKGHISGIQTLALSEDGSTLFSADFSGRMVYWDLAKGTGEIFEGKGHSSQMTAISIAQDTLISVGIDDVAIFSSVARKTYGDKQKLESQPQDVASGPNGLSAIACNHAIVLCRDGKVVTQHKMANEPSCVAISPSGRQIAVGTIDKLLLFDVVGNDLKEGTSQPHRGAVTALRYSPDGQYLAATDAAKRCTLYSTTDFKVLHCDMWSKHSAKVTCVAFSPDSKSIVTGSIDTCLVVYTDLTEKSPSVQVIKRAHANAAVNAVAWIDNNTFASADQKACIKIWKK